MKKIWDWLMDSHRWLHILIGLLIGFGSTSLYCAAYAGIGVAVTSELKDKLWGGLWDWWDFILTVLSVAIGYVIHGLIFGFIIV
jgi:hypothetical protein